MILKFSPGARLNNQFVYQYSKLHPTFSGGFSELVSLATIPINSPPFSLSSYLPSRIAFRSWEAMLEFLFGRLID